MLLDDEDEAGEISKFLVNLCESLKYAFHLAQNW